MPILKMDRLEKASISIGISPPSGDDITLTHSALCQVGLPRSKVEGHVFMRQSDAVWVNVEAGMLDEGNGPVLQPIPYGPMPRLALAWLSTYAKRNKTREIPIGRSAAEFLRLMGMDDQGARYATLRKQMHALAACRLQIGFKGRTFNSQPIEQFDAWIAKESDQRALWPGIIVLSGSYYDDLDEHSVPLDSRALHALKGSALALDVYCWLAQRLHRIKKREPVQLSWKKIREQFGQEYEGKDPSKDFKKAFLPALRDVQLIYPSADIRLEPTGLMLYCSPPPIPKDGLR